MLLASCAKTGEQPASRPDQAMTAPEPPPADTAARANANAVAGKAAAKAKRTEKAEGKQNLVKDEVAVKTGPDGKPLVEQVGEASWYGRFHHGKKTSTGARFDQNALTAAHPTLPLGTEVKVTNLENGRSVTVLINDRGPYARGRDIDLSRAAARRLGLAEDGAAPVRIDTVVSAGSERGTAPQ